MGVHAFFPQIHRGVIPDTTAGSCAVPEFRSSRLFTGWMKLTVTRKLGAIVAMTAAAATGSYAPAYMSLTVYPVSLAGTISTDSNAGCPGGVLSQAPFQLKQIG